MTRPSLLALAVSASILLSVAARACPALIEGVPVDRLKALSRGVNADGWIAEHQGVWQPWIEAAQK